MSGPTGKVKTPGSGRQKGTPNKKTQELMEKCKAMGVDPFEVLLDFAKNSLDPNIKMQAAKEVCQYLYPKRKATEISTDKDEGISITVRDYTSENQPGKGAPKKP